MKKITSFIVLLAFLMVSIGVFMLNCPAAASSSSTNTDGTSSSTASSTASSVASSTASSTSSSASSAASSTATITLPVKYTFEGQTVTYVSNTATICNGRITLYHTLDGITIDANSKTATVDGEDLSFTDRLKLGGTGSTTDRYIKFDVPGNCTIFFVSLPSSSTALTRTFTVSDGTTGLYTSTGYGSGSVAKVESFSYVGGAKSLYVYSNDQGINFYLIKLK